MSLRELIYNEKYLEIPKEEEERLKLLLECKTPNKSIQLNELVKKNINILKKIKVNKFSFIWYSIPVPSKRPRVNIKSGYPQIYVPDARKNLNDFERFFKEEYPNFKTINTPMTITIKGYTPTPSNFNKLQKILAELKILRPWGRVFDTDNFYKAATDQMIGSVISDDSLIDVIHGYKFYSIKPRIEYDIEYLDKFPEIIT